MHSTTGTREGTGIVWALVEDGFHVGSRDGEFLGYIEREPDGTFAAHNMYSQPAGTFTDLPAAMRALAAVQPVAGPRTR